MYPLLRVRQPGSKMPPACPRHNNGISPPSRTVPPRPFLTIPSVAPRRRERRRKGKLPETAGRRQPAQHNGGRKQGRGPRLALRVLLPFLATARCYVGDAMQRGREKRATSGSSRSRRRPPPSPPFAARWSGRIARAITACEAWQIGLAIARYSGAYSVAPWLRL